MTCPVWQNSYYIFKIPLQTELLQWSRQVTLKVNCQRRSIRQRMNSAVGKMSPGYQSLLNMRGIRVTSLNFEVLQSQLAFDFLFHIPSYCKQSSWLLSLKHSSNSLYHPSCLIWATPKNIEPLHSSFLLGRWRQRGAVPFQLSAHHFHEFFWPHLL